MQEGANKKSLRARARGLYESMPRPLRRISVLLVGGVILVAGLAMLVLPGPGLLVMGVAIAVLALEFDWARKLADAIGRAARSLAQRLGLTRLRRPSPEQPDSKSPAPSHRSFSPPPD
jgi:uncharacterized protein (TIGR02611 family)